jgi:hypothetical protein
MPKKSHKRRHHKKHKKYSRKHTHKKLHKQLAFVGGYGETTTQINGNPVKNLNIPMALSDGKVRTGKAYKNHLEYMNTQIKNGY